jgi:hypothetical protein
MTTKKQSLRDELRAATVGAKKVFRTKSVEWNGLKFEFRQPSLAGRRKLRDKALDDGGMIDIFEALVWGVIWNTYVPGTDELVFEETDYDSLVSTPPGGFMDEFAVEIAELYNLDAASIGKN